MRNVAVLILHNDKKQILLRNEFGDANTDIVVACTKDDSIKDPVEKIEKIIRKCVSTGKDALIVKAADVLDSFHWYTGTQNENELLYCKRSADAIIKFKPKEFHDHIFDELEKWRQKMNKIQKYLSSMNIHHMKLDPYQFDQIKAGAKIDELRLHDKKRRTIMVGDVIEFAKRSACTAILRVEVVSLTRHKTFADLYEAVKSRYPDWTKEAFIDGMYEHYSKDDEEKYGALKIGIQLTN